MVKNSDAYQKSKGRPKKERTEPKNVNSVPPVKRGKGRPKKETIEPENVDLVSPVKRGKGRPAGKRVSTPPVKKGRGRPPKKLLEEEQSEEEESKEKQSEEEPEIAAVAEEENTMAPTTPSPSGPEPLSQHSPPFATKPTSSAYKTLPTTEILHDDNHAGPEQSRLTKVSKPGRLRNVAPKTRKQMRFIGFAGGETPKINGESIR
ncbi:MAG: hypothetical protein Q9198_010079 [Flavoplaca austrocitrina]